MKGKPLGRFDFLTPSKPHFCSCFSQLVLKEFECKEILWLGCFSPVYCVWGSCRSFSVWGDRGSRSRKSLGSSSSPGSRKGSGGSTRLQDCLAHSFPSPLSSEMKGRAVYQGLPGPFTTPLHTFPSLLSLSRPLSSLHGSSLLWIAALMLWNFWKLGRKKDIL